MKKEEKEAPSILRTILTIIGIISGVLSALLIGFILYGFIMAFDGGQLSDGNVAIIPITSIIASGEVGFGESFTTSAQIIEWIDEAEADDDVQAVLFRIDSPGGTPVATEEIANRILAMEKPNVAVIHEIGASGAYWVSSATDKIYASRMSMVGSIGVLASYIEFAGTLERYNATYRSLTAGQFKDTGSPFKELTPTEQEMIERQLDKVHDIFIQAIAENRGLPEDKVRQIATGWVYLGQEALELGLIDTIGTEDDALLDLEDALGITATTIEYQQPVTVLQELFGVTKEAAFYVGKGLGSALTENNGRITT